LIKENEISNGSIIFSQTNYVVAEDAGFALVTLIRTNGNQGRVSVNFNTVDGTAGVDSDYSRLNATLTMEDTETNVSVRIPILDDPRREPNELLNLQLSDPIGGVSIAQSHATLVITDNDFNPGYFEFTTNELSQRFVQTLATTTFTFFNGSNFVTVFTNFPTFTTLTNVFYNDRLYPFVARHAFDDGAQGSQVSGFPVGHHNPHGTLVTVTRKGGSDGIATVDYRTRTTPALTNALFGGVSNTFLSVFTPTAIDGIHYTNVNGTLTFMNGETAKAFIVPTIDNIFMSNSVYLDVELSNPQGADLGIHTNATIEYEFWSDAAFTRAIYYISESLTNPFVWTLGSGNRIVEYVWHLEDFKVGGATSNSDRSPNNDLPAGFDHATRAADWTEPNGGGSSSGIVHVPHDIGIVDDSTPELDEAYQISLRIGNAHVDWATGDH